MIIEGGVCLDRSSWVDLDSRNFVDLNLEAQIYPEEVNEKSDARTICRTKDGSAVEGVTLYLGKFCRCPDSAPYFDRNDQTCKTAQQVNDGGSLTGDGWFNYNWENYQHYFIIDMDECFKIQKSVSANKKVCTSTCGGGYTRGQNFYGQQFCVCANSKFYDAGKDACVTEDACDGYTYRLDY